MKLVSIGFGCVVAAERIVAVVSPDSSSVKRIIQEAREGAYLIDATYGRKTKSVIITDSEHVVLSAVPADKIAVRIDDGINFDEDAAYE